MKNYIFAVTALFLLTSSAAFAQIVTDPDPPPLGSHAPKLKLLKQFSFEKDQDIDAHASTIAFDRNRVYVTSPDGLVMAAPSLHPRAEFSTVFQPEAKSVNRVYVYDNALYVLTTPREGQQDHTHFKSTDRGQTFQPIDYGLLECSSGSCRYLYSTELFAKNDLLFVNAGGGENLLVSNNDGTSFHAASGEIKAIACYHNTFDIRAREVLMGGECKLDDAFLKRGILSENKLYFDVPLQPVESPELGNRKINAVQFKPGTSLALAANEGGLLRSVDSGQSFQYAFEYPVGEGPYPYTSTILFPNSRPELALIGGWDKGANIGKMYLAYSADQGATWKDISYLLDHVDKGIVTQLAEDNHGRIIAVAVDVVQKTVSLLELQIPHRAGSANSVEMTNIQAL